MKVSLRWLREYVDLPEDDPERLAEAFDRLGHEVESLVRLDVPFQGVVVSRVEARRPHPDADRLQLVEVDAGDRRVEVVCGAWNFEEGDLAPLALPGAVLAEGLEVGEREIRGVVSTGMLCSPNELGLSPDAEGILILREGEPGKDLIDQLPLPDVVFDLSIGTNRPDCMSVVGLARELAAYYGADLTRPEDHSELGSAKVEVSIDIEDSEGCPRYVGLPVLGPSGGPSPLWMQLRLRAAGIRPINAVVDVTNFVLLELGQPIHAFDLDRLGGPAIVVRRAHPGEQLTTLDGVRRELHREDLVIADADRPVALAGVMGGEDSEVGEETSRILIESAYFDPSAVLMTAKRHGLRTEASSRFERGVDPNGAEKAALRVVQLLTEIDPRAQAGAPIDRYPAPIESWQVEFPEGEVKRLLGIEVPAERVRSILTSLELELEGVDPITATVPTFRPDLTRKADLVEEVARLHGYDRIPETLPKGPGGGLPLALRDIRRLRQVLVGAGYHEALSLSFLGHEDLKRLNLGPSDPRSQAIEVVNPLREQESLLRTTLIPGLLRTLAYNRSRRSGPGAIFEIGRVFLRGGPELPDQPEMLTFLNDRSDADVHDATALWELVADAMRIENWELRPMERAPFHPSRGAAVVVDGEEIGMVGEIHPSVTRDFDLDPRLAAGELRVQPLVGDPTWWQFEDPSPFPPVIFDMAFELDESVPAGDLLRVVRGAAGSELERVELFDVFRGAPLPEGRKSLAVNLVLRARDRTLTDEEAQTLRFAITEAVADRLGGRLRGAQ